MEEKNNIENKNKESKENEVNMGFFKKVWYSITKIEKYPNMSAQGLGKALTYLVKIISIFAIIICLGSMYQTYFMVKEGVEYLQNSFPDFSYKDGILDVKTEEKIVISAEDSYAGETIIDTKTDDQAVIDEYINQVTNEGGGLVILKDRIEVKNPSVAGKITYSYKESLDKIGITEFNKQDVINAAKSGEIVSLYVSIFITMFMYAFSMYFLSTLSNAILLSFFGYLTTWLAKIKMRYVAIFNMAIYALTLSTILNILYVAVNIFIPFEMEYFQVMYVAVAAIYLVAAIFILKTDFVKKQMELMKIAEAQEIIKRQMEEKEREEQNRKEKEEQKKKEKEKEEKNKEKKENDNQEPEGSGA